MIPNDKFLNVMDKNVKRKVLKMQRETQNNSWYSFDYKKLADNVTKQIQRHFLNTNSNFIMPDDTSFMEQFTKDVWSLCILSWNSEKWRKVSDELPNDNIDVLVKIDIQGYIHYDVNRIIYGEWCNGDDGIVEWKPIY